MLEKKIQNTEPNEFQEERSLNVHEKPKSSDKDEIKPNFQHSMNVANFTPQANIDGTNPETQKEGRADSKSRASVAIDNSTDSLQAINDGINPETQKETKADSKSRVSVPVGDLTDSPQDFNDESKPENRKEDKADYNSRVSVPVGDSTDSPQAINDESKPETHEEDKADSNFKNPVLVVNSSDSKPVMDGEKNQNIEPFSTLAPRRPVRKRVYDSIDKDVNTYVEKPVPNSKRVIEHAHLNKSVAEHYNKKAKYGSSTVLRSTQKSYNIRQFNNWVKQVLLSEAVKHINDEIIVLDMACGKGGDLQKWQNLKISEYVGIDIAESAIYTARERNQKINCPFNATYHIDDCFRKPIENILETRNIKFKFNIVSIQFALHYAFESEASARQVLANVSNVLQRSGKLVLTIVNSDCIAKRFADEAAKTGKMPKKIGNSLYSLEFPQPPDISWKPPFGQTYDFFLQDSIDNLQEFVIPFNILRSLALDYNLDLKWKRTFYEIYMEFKDGEYAELFDKFGIYNSAGEQNLEPDEWKPVGLYFALIFEKR